MSNTMFSYRVLEVFQDMQTGGGVNFTCDYKWSFSNYYGTVIGVKTYVPYIHFYFNDERNRFTGGPQEVGVWMDGSFDFAASPGGRDRISIDAASPQPRTGPGGGDNLLSVDNIRYSPVLNLPLCELVSVGILRLETATLEMLRCWKYLAASRGGPKSKGGLGEFPTSGYRLSYPPARNPCGSG
jgi:hypothetical protein